jgi:tRNA(Arg) A34 adenosine deaminase TadA
MKGNSKHTYFMRQAIELSLKTIRKNAGGPFGAVIVKNGEFIANGTNRVTSTNDPTAHAEIIAIRSACYKLGTFHLNGCEIYASCEPCPMCLAAIYWARIDKIYYANTRSDASYIGFDDGALYEELAKPLSNRTMPMDQLLRDEALTVFQEWQNKEDKIQY